jgi:hypothetical protein
MRAFNLTLGLTLAASGCGKDATGPDVLHIANVSYSESSTCGFMTCSGTIRFRLLNQRNAGRSGQVIASSSGGILGQTVTTRSDGWGEVEWGFDPRSRPITVIVCPAEVHDSARCGAASIF